MSLLSAPLNVHILRALATEPKGLTDLRRAVGSPPQSTMRVYARALNEIGVLERRRREGFPGSADYEITSTGSSLLRVGDILQEWLQVAPDGPIQLGSPAAKSAIKALVEGWSSNIVRALAAKPLSLTELNRLIPKISYPTLERRLGGMRLVGLVKPHPGMGRGTPYTSTPWLRRAVVPLASAAGWERRHIPGAVAPIGRLDVEAAFLLPIPMMELPSTASGRCRLAVEVQGGSTPLFAGVLLDLQGGRVVSCTSRLEGEVEAWAAGKPSAWLRRMEGDRDGGLAIGGDAHLAEAVTESIRSAALIPG